MSISEFQKNKHLLLRAGFGANLNQIKDLENRSLTEIWQKLSFNYPFKPLILNETSENIQQNVSKMDAETKKAFQKKNRQQNVELNLKFLDQMIYSEDQLREKMAFFWHGHFATRIQNSKFNLQLLNIIREKALGKFGDLLVAVSQSPAMLQFLNNQQNRKDHPNENFAREVMELFTLGRGNYTEKDIQEAARAFTGWSFLPDVSFLEKQKAHDFESKTFLGKTGNFDGNDVINIILEKKETAKFIVNEIYKFFVNENIDLNVIDVLAEEFYESNYEIKNLMTSIFTSKWFFKEENIGVKIKSPIELMVGIMRILPMQIEKPENITVYQKLLGQMLLYPPNVAGWPSGKSWIDSSSLMLRLQIPQIWSGLRPLEFEPKSDDDVEMGMKNAQNRYKSFKNPNIVIDWNLVEKVFDNKKASDFLLQKKSSLNEKTVAAFSNNSIRQTIINIMSTPEFQLT